jgi:hypothetical protein
MFAECLLGGTGQNVGEPEPTGFRVALRLNWYRALPISCIERLELSIDGATVPAQHMTLRLAGREYAVDGLAAHDDDWWFVLDEAELVVEKPGGLSPGEHDAQLVLGTRIPYFGPDPAGGFAVLTDRAEARVVLR